MSQTISQRKAFALPKTSFALIGGILSIILALVASFVLANWAESSSFAHGLQHILLITAGIGIGSSVTYQLAHKKESK